LEEWELFPTLWKGGILLLGFLSTHRWVEYHPYSLGKENFLHLFGRVGSLY